MWCHTGQPNHEEVTVISGDPFIDGINLTHKTYRLDDVRLLAPITARSGFSNQRRG
ncbi:DUF2437 domain-containing protein [Paenarthrobacter sp. NyZ202]|uniref:DUF2437 domain-containing protein n=1 Tax=Paenarthrobacter sp. NyZ202 TaxID=3402689 RepID=UPI003CF401A8